jgi:hypothetical protein
MTTTGRTAFATSVAQVDKKKEFNRVLVAVFAFIALSLLILGASYDVPVSLFSFKFTLGILYYPFILLEILVIAYVAKTALAKSELTGAP